MFDLNAIVRARRTSEQALDMVMDLIKKATVATPQEVNAIAATAEEVESQLMKKGRKSDPMGIVQTNTLDLVRMVTDAENCFLRVLDINTNLISKAGIYNECQRTNDYMQAEQCLKELAGSRGVQGLREEVERMRQYSNRFRVEGGGIPTTPTEPAWVARVEGRLTQILDEVQALHTKLRNL